MTNTTYLQKLQQNTNPVRVYIPKSAKEANAWGLAPGTAIVSRDAQDQTTVLGYYEGNIYDSENLVEFGQRALCATGRLIERYPTTAKRQFPSDGLVEVGIITVGRPAPIPVPKPFIGVPLSSLPAPVRRALEPEPQAMFVATAEDDLWYQAWAGEQQSSTGGCSGDTTFA